MKMVKSLVLGSAAALVVMGGAQAADLPVKAKAVEYVKVCSLYGAGFWYIPGTDTCLKLGGYLRVDVLANTNSDDTGNVSGPGGAKNRFTNGYDWRSREDFTIDTRTVTEYGVLRTFADVVWTWNTNNFSGTGTGAHCC
jgi:opacity protein-like surface antigen